MSVKCNLEEKNYLRTRFTAYLILKNNHVFSELKIKSI